MSQSSSFIPFYLKSVKQSACHRIEIQCDQEVTDQQRGQGIKL